MDLLWSGSRQAIALLAGADREIWGILWLSLQVSGTATLVSLALGVPAGAALALARFPGRGMAGSGGIISEIRASMMVGGNIKGQARTLATAMVLETGEGNFEIAIALALLLLVLIFLVNWLLTTIQQLHAR